MFKIHGKETHAVAATQRAGRLLRAAFALLLLLTLAAPAALAQTGDEGNTGDGLGGDPCTLPGVRVTVDPAGDAILPQYDILWAAVAEPGDLDNKLVFTLKVASLGTVPPNAEWRVRFSGFFFGEYFVGMNTLNPTRGPVFDYGHYTYGSRGERIPVIDGEADGGEYFADGTIRVVMSPEKTGPGFAVGQMIYGIMAETRVISVSEVFGYTGVVDDVLRGYPYTLVGNASCNAAPVAPPAAPAGLTAVAPGNSSPEKRAVTLNWSDNSDNEQVFRVERSISATAGFIEIGTVGAGVTTYTDTTVQGRSTYHYRVRASNEGGDSAYSNTASVFVK
ncbi:MAG TPA: fibronectin type III domain-containing protein [Pyrinomonadaceae bacterium]|jgi:hypothetical protein